MAFPDLQGQIRNLSNDRATPPDRLTTSITIE